MDDFVTQKETLFSSLRSTQEKTIDLSDNQSNEETWPESKKSFVLFLRIKKGIKTSKKET